MTSTRITWHPPRGFGGDPIHFPAGSPATGAVTERTLGDILLEHREPSGASNAVSLPKAFAANLANCQHIPHAYIHYGMSTASDGTRGEGSSPEPHTALETSIYEVMERFFGSRYEQHRLSYGPYEQLAPHAVDPRDLVLLTPFEHEQARQPFTVYSPELPLHWHPGYQIDGDELIPRLLPATLSILKFSWAHPGERFAPSLSPGTASGPDLKSALLHGIYELIERDAFILAWLLRRRGPRLLVSDLGDPRLTRSRQNLLSDGFDLTFVDLTTELGIPVVLAMIGRAGNPYLSFGMGSNVDIGRAVQRAYCEALELLTNYYDMSQPGQLRPLALEFTDPELDLEAYFEDCRFLMSSSRSRTVQPTQPTSRDHASELQTCLNALAAYGAEVYFLELTPPEMAGASYRLVRVLCSRLQPHLYELDSWRLANPRLPTDVSSVNLTPNPFAVLEHCHPA